LKAKEISEEDFHARRTHKKNQNFFSYLREKCRRKLLYFRVFLWKKFWQKFGEKLLFCFSKKCRERRFVVVCWKHGTRLHSRKRTNLKKRLLGGEKRAPRVSVKKPSLRRDEKGGDAEKKKRKFRRSNRRLGLSSAESWDRIPPGTFYFEDSSALKNSSFQKLKKWAKEMSGSFRSLCGKKISIAYVCIFVIYVHVHNVYNLFYFIETLNIKTWIRDSLNKIRS
jgi:hypothetical protein